MTSMTARGTGPNWRRAMMILCVVLALSVGAVAQSTTELIIHNGLIVTVEGRREADLRIRNGTIAEIGRNLAGTAGAREIDARAMLVLPGGVDPHSHLTGERLATEPAGAVVEDYISGSTAAVAGGVTTVTNFVSKQANEDVGAFLDRNVTLVEKNAIADFLLHVNVGSDPSWLTPKALETMVSRGFTSTKTFMRETYFDTNAVAFVKAFRLSGAAGVLSMIHCEDASILADLGEVMVADGRGSLQNLGLSRPVVTEVLAVQRAVAIAEVTSAPIYIVHLSSERALRVAEEAQARGLPIYVETRPMLIHLTEERFLQPDAGLYAGSPPLRSKRDTDALWEGIAKGTVHTVGTDHGVRSREEKVDPSLNVSTRREGVSNIQDYRPMLYSEGVRTGRITIEQFVAVTATNPAKIFGMYPRKGTIQVGSDADVVIWDPNLRRTIRDQDELSVAKWSLYAGWEVTGWPRTTIRRGEIVYQDGKVIGRPGTGKVILQARWTKPALVSSR
jgi:dihydropyrimidinase